MKILILMLSIFMSMYANENIDNGINAYSAGKYASAFSLFKIEAKKDNPVGKHLLASLYYQGQGVEKKIEKALSLFKEAAKKDYLPSIANLGVMYSEGNGVKQNYKIAFIYYKKAAELGDLQSKFNLAQFYRKGTGVTQNYNAAAKLYKELAVIGVLEAQNEYGLMYAQGQGVKLDYIQAYAWINMPAEAGDSQSVKNRNQLLQILNKTQQTKAIALANEYKTKYSKNKMPNKMHEPIGCQPRS